jgi:hypothetical protein
MRATKELEVMASTRHDPLANGVAPPCDPINAHTLGQLLKRLKRDSSIRGDLQTLLLKALAERNRLSHSFYRQHNWRRNSDDGTAVMMKDLESIHDTLLNALKAVHLLSGVDLDAMVEQGVPLPTRHLPI